MDALIANARFHFHKQLFETNTLTLTTAGVASNADTSSRGSKAIARRIVDILVEEQHHAVSTVDKISGQTLGKQFETLFSAMDDPYMKARSADVRDVASRLLRCLRGGLAGCTLYHRGRGTDAQPDDPA